MASPNQRIGNLQNREIYLKAMPAVPDDVKKRFPSMNQWEKDLKEWVRKVVFNLQGQ